MLNILLANNNFLFQLFLEETLVEMGHWVISKVSSTKELLPLLNHVHPELIVVDVDLVGDMGVLELTSFIKDNHKIPIVYIYDGYGPELFGKLKLATPLHIIYQPYCPETIRKEFDTIIRKLKNIPSDA